MFHDELRMLIWFLLMIALIAGVWWASKGEKDEK